MIRTCRQAGRDICHCAAGQRGCGWSSWWVGFLNLPPCPSWSWGKQATFPDRAKPFFCRGDITAFPRMLCYLPLATHLPLFAQLPYLYIKLPFRLPTSRSCGRPFFPHLRIWQFYPVQSQYCRHLRFLHQRPIFPRAGFWWRCQPRKTR